MEKAGIREVKKFLSRYIRKVKMGETITITKRGIPVARLSPVHTGSLDRMLRMVDEGLACWKGGKPGQSKPLRKKMIKGRDLSEIVNEDRR